MQVRQIAREFWVVTDGGAYLAGPFPTHAAARAWIDRHTDEDRPLQSDQAGVRRI
jgi:hypothetical protein